MNHSPYPQGASSQNPMQSWGNHAPPPRKSSFTWLWILLGILCGGFALLVIACAGFIWYLTSPPGIDSATANQLFPVAEVPVVNFPPRGFPEERHPGVVFYEVTLPDQDGDYPMPGDGGRLWIYTPPGASPPASRPCILIAPAGSTLMEGMELGEGDVPEHLPYIEAGFVVVAYELDGFGMEEEIGPNSSLSRFQAAQAGLVNARNALEYTLKNLEMVDPQRVYAAGHSSAGTLALLFAEHEPRLAGCISFAPAVDVEGRLPPFLRKMIELASPGACTFLARSSPKRHIAHLKCPTFLFYAEDDTTIETADLKQFHSDLQAAGGKATLKTVPTGGHYDPMIEEGIHSAIEWLRSQGALR